MFNPNRHQIIKQLLGPGQILATWAMFVFSNLVNAADPAQPAQFHASANGKFEQCVGLSRNKSSFAPETLQAINQFIPSGANLYCGTQTVLEDSDDLHFVYLVYGNLKGCDENCYASSLCAINDHGKNYLYSAVWYDHQQPAGTEQECPSLDGALTGDTNIYCERPTSGYHKSAGLDMAFWHLRNPVQSNPFRFCFM